MLSKFLCKIGLHNWKILKLESLPQLWEDVRAEEENRFQYDIISFGYPLREKKVCRRCEKYIDTITPYKEKIRLKVKKEIALEEKYDK